MKQIALLFYVILLTITVQAQTRQITGRVLSAEDGESLIGVSLKVKGSNRGVSSDAQGRFVLNVQQEENVILLISYIGYKPQEINAGNRSALEIRLVPESKSLNEVVVVGYGTQSRRAVTGSVASVNYDNFKDRSVTNVTQALAGQLPGVNITQSQGAPGQSPNIRIRGTSSITAGTNPLYVVDGLPIENFNLNNINPQDIQSVEVLKDASSAAIYGSRGSNGVVLVTTKLGKVGETQVNANYEYGTQEVTRKVDMMDAQQFVQYYIDAHNNAYLAAGGDISSPNEVRPTIYRIPVDFTDPALRARLGKGTDWQDVMFRKAGSHNAQVSVSGGSEKTQFLFSGAYLDQEAVMDNNYYKRLTVRSNIKQKISE